MVSEQRSRPTLAAGPQRRGSSLRTNAFSLDASKTRASKRGSAHSDGRSLNDIAASVLRTEAGLKTNKIGADFWSWLAESSRPGPSDIISTGICDMLPGPDVSSGGMSAGLTAGFSSTARSASFEIGMMQHNTMKYYDVHICVCNSCLVCQTRRSQVL